MTRSTKKRCDWGQRGGELMIAYHDDEWGVPVHDDRKQFEFLTLESAQAGLSWLVVLRKREAYRRRLPISILKKWPASPRSESSGCSPTRASSAIGLRSWPPSITPGAFSTCRRSSARSTNTFGALSAADRSRTRSPRMKDIRATSKESDCAQQRSQAARLQVRRQHDRVRPHAGRRHGERPPGDVLPAQGRGASEMSLRRLTRIRRLLARAGETPSRRRSNLAPIANIASRSKPSATPVQSGKPGFIAARKLLRHRQGVGVHPATRAAFTCFEAAAQFGRVARVRESRSPVRCHDSTARIVRRRRHPASVGTIFASDACDAG